MSESVRVCACVCGVCGVCVCVCVCVVFADRSNVSVVHQYSQGKGVLRS